MFGAKVSGSSSPLHVVMENNITSNVVESLGYDVLVEARASDTILNNLIFDNDIYGLGIQDATGLNSYCVNSIGNNYFGNATGPLC